MKRILLVLVAAFALSGLQAQDKQTNPFYDAMQPKPTAYLGFATGLNSPAGIIGPQLKIVVTDKFMLGAAVGLGSWGYKYSGSLEYHPKGVYEFYMKGGYMYATGLNDMEIEMELADHNDRTVFMDLKPVSNIFLSFGKAWKLGKKNRFYLESGYAIPMVTSDYYEVTSGDQLSENSKTLMQMMCPGGLILALGFDFGI